MQSDPRGGGLEYLHRGHASRKRRQKGNPVPGGLTGFQHVPGDINTGPGTRWGSLKWDSKIWPWVLRDFDLRVTALARPKSICAVNYRSVLSLERALITNPQLSKQSFKEEEKLVTGLRCVPDTKTDCPTDCRP
jgi:hypothetical protein